MHYVCEQCQLYKVADNPHIQGRGQLDKETVLFLIGEAPGWEENVKNEVFIGRAGYILNKGLKLIAPKGGYYITNAVKCFPKDEETSRAKAFRIPSEHEVSLCNHFLAEEVSQVDPSKCVLMPLGNTALSALFGQEHEKITKVAGRTLEIKLADTTYKVIPNYHPSYILRNPSKTPVFEAILRMGYIYYRS